MINAKAKISFDQKGFAKKAWRRMTPPLQRGASMIARSAKASIKKSGKKHSRPGQPPYTRGKSHSLKKSIMYHVDKAVGQAIIGPSGYKTGLTGHFHEFGGVQRIKGRRNSYVHDGAGPLDVRDGYVNPSKSKHPLLRGVKFSRRNAIQGVVFGKLKTSKQVRRAQYIDKLLWPDAEKWRRRIYPQRRFMWPAVQKNRISITKLFANVVK